tara:strand:+ start:83 stop:412 length:330 start_codon:yes stop_codon:yes gene_type:complete
MGQHYIMRVVGLTGYQIGGGPQPTGMVQSYDPEGHGGYGDVALTQDLQAALRFHSLESLHDVWTSVPRCRPTRPDGMPNRPLTAYSIAPVPVELDKVTGLWRTVSPVLE